MEVKLVYSQIHYGFFYRPNDKTSHKLLLFEIFSTAYFRTVQHRLIGNTWAT